ncbi:hypothetical protein [Geobacillus thermodenitrificans]|uniref:hypothetical protein n=1 Tax=Geobacillus thermodenitrificans TaxID=33940 RepID=UPI002E1E4C1C|nr:hypothetical protein [Geobacillus thermodenitrificans]
MRLDHIPKLDLQPFRFSPPGPMGWGWIEDDEFFDQLLLGLEEEGEEEEEEETDVDLPPVLVELGTEGEGQEAVIPLPLRQLEKSKKEKRTVKRKKESRRETRLKKTVQNEELVSVKQAADDTLQKQSQQEKWKTNEVQSEILELVKQSVADSGQKQRQLAEQESKKALQQAVQRQVTVPFVLSSTYANRPKTAGTNKRSNMFAIG